MHICATNICIWIRTLVIESLKEITLYHQGRGPNPDDGAILDTIRTHSLRHAGTVMGTNYGRDADWESINVNIRERVEEQPVESVLSRIVQSTAKFATEALRTTTTTVATDADIVSSSTSGYNRPSVTSTSSPTPSTTSESPSTTDATTMMRKLKKFISSTTNPTTASAILTSSISDDDESSNAKPFGSFISSSANVVTQSSTTTPESIFNNLFAGMENAYQYSGLSHNDTYSSEQDRSFESLDALFPAALTGTVSSTNTNTSCGRINIMGTIVQDSAPYLYPFIIEYSLIGAVVIYVMWKHIGRYPKYTEEDLEHRLEVMLSRRAVAMAQAHSGRVDCVGASKGLFFGLLLLVGSLICLILFFVLVRHNQFSLLAIYLADVSHCALMAFAVFAIFVGFIRFVFRTFCFNFKLCD